MKNKIYVFSIILAIILLPVAGLILKQKVKPKLDIDK
jgi:hypothetical protein